MSVAIIDYGSGNLRSAQKALERAARETDRDQPILVTSNPDQLRDSERIVLPGVGAFGDCRAGLAAIAGMSEALHEAVLLRGKPLLGICVGMQLFADFGREHGGTAGLGWIGGEVTLIRPADPGLKVPHMGWNTLEMRRAHPLLDGIACGEAGLHAYFVHSYHFEVGAAADLIAQTDYGGPLTAMVGRNNIVGTQFHPENSQRLGLALLGNFLRWRP
jgi:imidazole glycerol-phosphate synthase subunit HisH